MVRYGLEYWNRLVGWETSQLQFYACACFVMIEMTTGLFEQDHGESHESKVTTMFLRRSQVSLRKRRKAHFYVCEDLDLD